jgi:hypothetical protein
LLGFCQGNRNSRKCCYYLKIKILNGVRWRLLNSYPSDVSLLFVSKLGFSLLTDEYLKVFLFSSKENVIICLLWSETVQPTSTLKVQLRIFLFNRWIPEDIFRRTLSSFWSFVPGLWREPLSSFAFLLPLRLVSKSRQSPQKIEPT